MTPTQIIRDWYAEHDRDIHQCGIDGFHATELMAALAPMFAASPWRYDVENAPKDILLLCWQWTPEDCDWNQIIMRKHEDGTWECGDLLCEHDPPIAFATINQPETPHA